MIKPKRYEFMVDNIKINNNNLQTFVSQLRNHNLTKQQIKTLRGQAINGDLVGAKKGLERLTEVKANEVK